MLLVLLFVSTFTDLAIGLVKGMVDITYAPYCPENATTSAVPQLALSRVKGVTLTFIYQ